MSNVESKDCEFAADGGLSKPLEKFRCPLCHRIHALAPETPEAIADAKKFVKTTA